jgi:hypothetical protein
MAASIARRASAPLKILTHANNFLPESNMLKLPCSIQELVARS